MMNKCCYLSENKRLFTIKELCSVLTDITVSSKDVVTYNYFVLSQNSLL